MKKVEFLKAGRHPYIVPTLEVLSLNSENVFAASLLEYGDYGSVPGADEDDAYNF